MAIELDVLFADEKMGSLKLNADRFLEFQYDQSWILRKEAIPLSVRIPLQNKVFQDHEIRPFFENLLPESTQRKIIAKEFKISEKNIFALLEAIGGECAGAVSLWPKNSSIKTNSFGNLAISNVDLGKIIKELPTHPLMASKNLRLSLAGVQDKLLIYMKNEKIYLPSRNQPSSHILKPDIAHFENTVINEYFCMSLARLVGLPVPSVNLFRIDQPLYIIERFDRKEDGAGKLKRIHQEDFCQASKCLSDQKYESEGGPSLKFCFELVRTYSIHPAKDVHNLIQWVIFNYLIGNADAHGKNIAFLLTEAGPFLAPFYDILSTEIYPRLSKKFAMKIGGENRGDWIKLRHWERFAQAIEVKSSLVQSVAGSLLKSIHSNRDNISGIIKQFEKNEQEFCHKILKFIEKRSLELQTILS